MKIIAKVLLTALTLLVVAEFVPGIAIVSVTAAIVAAVVLGLLNVLVKPFIVLLTLPVTVITLGLFMLIINAVFFSAAALLVNGFSVEGFLPALIGSIVVSVVSAIGNRFFFS